MTDLSPAAQAVLTAVTQQEYCLDPSEIPTEAARIGYLLSAALRAAGDTLSHPTSAHTLYAIADELEGIKYGTYRCNLEDKPQ
jgi:hypothetical protein